MSRDQRADDNWALLYARELSLHQHQPLVVLFTLDLHYPEANIRHYNFMLHGLMLLEQQLIAKDITLLIVVGKPEEQLIKIINDLRVGCLVTDFDPLRVKKNGRSQ